MNFYLPSSEKTPLGFNADTLVIEVLAELVKARAAHIPMTSIHEGYAVILEEFDELWDEIKVKHPDPAKLRKEAIQLAAMALRFLIEVAYKQVPDAAKGLVPRCIQCGERHP